MKHEITYVKAFGDMEIIAKDFEGAVPRIGEHIIFEDGEQSPTYVVERVVYRNQVVNVNTIAKQNIFVFLTV